MLKLLSIVLVFSLNLFAQWMFVNDDGTLTPYNEASYDNSYAIPKDDVVKEIVIKPKKHHKRKRVHHKKKKVNKKSQPKVNIEVVGDKTMYLTFDDGPLDGTQNVINILQEEGISATMFMIGKHIKASASRKRLFNMAVDDPLIVVANHTYSHANRHYRRFYSDPYNVVDDLNRMSSILRNTFTGGKYCRLAGRNVFRVGDIRCDDPAIPKSRHEERSYNALEDDGFNIFGWDYQWDYRPRDGKLYKSPREMLRRINRIYNRGRTKKRGKFILLMHDFTFKDRFNGKEKLRELITLLRNDGWNFDSIENY